MLYVTTREKYDAFTTARTLASDCGPDGGRYLPYKMPHFSAEELAAMKERSFGQNVADVLNLFFSTHFSGWDIEFCIGRYPVKLAPMGQTVLVAECWRNLDGNYEKMERNLAARICGCGAREVKITSWLRIAIRIAVLTGIFAELARQGAVDGKHPIDIAVPDGDLTLPMAVWYGRLMGLPVANIIIGCGDGSDAWDLLHNGQLRTVGGVMPELERLIYGALGVEEALRYWGICGRGEVYTLLPEMLRKLRGGIFSAVVSQERLNAMIPNVYRTSAYIMEPDAAVSYSGLMDYRTRTGESRCALLLADRNPADAADEVAAALRITKDQLKEKLG